MDPKKLFAIKPGSNVKIKSFDPDQTAEFKDKDAAAKTIEENTSRCLELQTKLYAENTRAVLLVLQGMDTAGKDGTVFHVMRGLNPTACRVETFKRPTEEELDHDFLWRIHKLCPRRGEITVFNRSHYEDVLVVRVHNLVPKDVWSQRYEHINAFEQMLTDAGTRIIKCFLHISKDEQKQRLQERLKDPTKNWKFEEGDLKERELWDDYMDAYQAMLEKTSTPHAPWHVIPANKKWFRNLCVSQLLVQTLTDMDPKLPKPRINVAKVKVT
jgi:PPK2 family polyphosphate:nucleotide phosphotransferase